MNYLYLIAQMLPISSSLLTLGMLPILLVLFELKDLLGPWRFLIALENHRVQKSEMMKSGIPNSTLGPF